MSPMRTMRNPWKASGRRGRRMLMFSATGMCGAIRKPSTATATPNPAVPIKACLRNRRRSKSLGSLTELLHYRGRFSCGADTLVREKALQLMQSLGDTVVAAQEKQQQQQKATAAGEGARSTQTNTTQANTMKANAR